MRIRFLTVESRGQVITLGCIGYFQDNTVYFGNGNFLRPIWTLFRISIEDSVVQVK